jgi:hypothetical protein
MFWGGQTSLVHGKSGDKVCFFVLHALTSVTLFCVDDFVALLADLDTRVADVNFDPLHEGT